MAAVFRLQNSALRRLIQPILQNTRAISTSKKNSDTVTHAEPTEATSTAATGKNWVSYGFYTNDEKADRQTTHSVFFAAITLCMVIGGFVWAYMPDYQLRDWAQREAYLELRRREKLGLPLIDANLVDPKKFTLPSDEDLGDTEIII